MKRKWKILGIVFSIVLLMNMALLFWLGFSKMGPAMDKEIKPAKTPSGNESKQEDEQTVKRLSFAGVGDNLIHGAIYYYPDHSNGYDFSWMYEPIEPYVKNADLAYINAETIMIGEDYSEFSSYPTFNGPIELIKNISDAGFDWMAVSSNHSLDTGINGLIFENEYIKENFPNLTVTGSSAAPEDRKTPKVIDVNGLKVGVTGYTYGTNGIPVPEDYDWVINLYRNEDGTINYGMIKEDLDALKKVSDVQIVSMHWGDEYSTDPNDEQREIAEFLNEQGVEVIIGTHPHVIQTAEIIDNGDQQTLVYYSLGNFISAQDERERMVGGLADFKLNYDPSTGKTTFSDVKFIPTITWYPSGFYTFATYAMPEYTDTLAESHMLHVENGQDLSKEWVAEYVSDVFGMPEGIEVVLE